MTRKTDPGTSKTLHDKIKDWSPDPQGRQFLKFSPSTKKFWCDEHVLFLTPGSAANHAKEHQKTDLLKKTKATDLSKLSAADRKYIETLEAQQKPNVEDTDNFIPTTSDMLVDAVNKSFADSMAGMAKDPEFLYGFFILKDNGMIPYDWDAGTFLKACYKKYLDTFKISFSVDQDLSKVSESNRDWQISVMEENAEIRSQIESETVIETEEPDEDEDEEEPTP